MIFHFFSRLPLSTLDSCCSLVCDGFVLRSSGRVFSTRNKRFTYNCCTKGQGVICYTRRFLFYSPYYRWIQNFHPRGSCWQNVHLQELSLKRTIHSGGNVLCRYLLKKRENDLYSFSFPLRSEDTSVMEERRMVYTFFLNRPRP